MACVDLPPSVDRGEASVGVSAFLVPLGIDNAADGGFARPVPAPAKAISVGSEKFSSNVVGLRSALLMRRIAASRVQFGSPEGDIRLNEQFWLKHRRASLSIINGVDGGFAHPSLAPTKAMSVGSGKVRLQRRWALLYASLVEWRGWRLFARPG